MMSILRFFPLAVFAFCPLVPAADYHLDASKGNDAATGTSVETAWKTLDRANGHRFSPGDRLLLAAGQRWSGRLAPKGSGEIRDGKVVPIVIGKYGEGPLPGIDAEGKFPEALLLEDVSHWVVEDLQITNRGEERTPWRMGVNVSAGKPGPMTGNVLRRLHVLHVNGDLRKSHEGCGIFFRARGDSGAYFDGLVIEDCLVEKTDRNGICQRADGQVRSRGVIIRNNRLDDIGGDGIKLWGTNGGLIERNVVRKARARAVDAAAGIWPFDCDDTVIQFNEVSGTRGTKDGQGFDADYHCRRTIIQYNYSHGNDGGFLLVCGPGRATNDGTIVRYNLSRHDGVNSARVFHFGGHSTNTLVHNNTVHLGPKQVLPLFLFTDWKEGKANGARVANNLFLVEGTVRFELRHSDGTRFENNIIVGKPGCVAGELPEGVAIMGAMPPLTGPLVAGNGFASTTGYRPSTREGFPTGGKIPEPGEYDFFGRMIPKDVAPLVGAGQAP